jgi:hypothetical protein
MSGLPTTAQVFPYSPKKIKADALIAALIIFCKNNTKGTPYDVPLLHNITLTAIKVFYFIV